MNCRSFEELALLPNGTVNQAYRPLAISMYSLHVQRWLEVFPRNQLLIVNGDQLIYDPLSQVKRIESFLGKCDHYWIGEYFLPDYTSRTIKRTKKKKKNGLIALKYVNTHFNNFFFYLYTIISRECGVEQYNSHSRINI